MVMGSTVEKTEPALCSASGSTGALEKNGEPGKPGRHTRLQKSAIAFEWLLLEEHGDL